MKKNNLNENGTGSKAGIGTRNAAKTGNIKMTVEAIKCRNDGVGHYHDGDAAIP